MESRANIKEITHDTLLPMELSRAFSPKSQCKKSPRKFSPFNGAVTSLRDYKLVSKTFLSSYSSHSEFLEDEVLGKRRSHFSIAKAPVLPETNPNLREAVKPEYCIEFGKQAAEWMNSGIIRKASKIAKEQGIILFKSIQIELIPKKKQAKDCYIPFHTVPRLLYLKNQQLIQALAQCVSCDSKGDIILQIPKELCIEGKYKRNYKGEPQVITIINEGVQKELWIRPPKVEVYYPNSGKSEQFQPSARQIHEILTSGEKRFEKITEIILTPKQKTKCTESIDIKAKHSMYGMAKEKGNWMWYKLSGFAVKIEGADKIERIMKISLKQVEYLIAIAKHESILKVLKDRIVLAIAKNCEKYTEVDLSRCPAFLKYRGAFDLGKACEENCFTEQQRNMYIEIKGEKYVAHLLYALWELNIIDSQSYSPKIVKELNKPNLLLEHAPNCSNLDSLTLLPLYDNSSSSPFNISWIGQ